MKEMFEVLTVRSLNFEDQNGNPVVGNQLWLIHDTDEPGWHGHEVLKVWIPKGHSQEPAVFSLKHGDLIQITWNRHGKPALIELAQ